MEGSPIPVLTVPTAPYEDQRPTGGGGLRRPTGLFEGQRNYLPNFIQSVLSSIDLRDRQGCTMVVGSDGRYFSRTATEIVVQMAAANGVSYLVALASAAPPLTWARPTPALAHSRPPATADLGPDSGCAALPGPPASGRCCPPQPPRCSLDISYLRSSSSTLKCGSAKFNSSVNSEHTPVLIPDKLGECNG